MASHLTRALCRVVITSPLRFAAVARPLPQLVLRSFANAAASGGQVQTFLDRNEVAERVQSVLKNFEKVDAAKVNATAHFSHDLGLDSLDAVEVCMALEEEFMITIPDAEAEKILSVEDAISFIATHPQAK